MSPSSAEPPSTDHTAETPRTGWSAEDLASDPHAHEAKAEKVRGMFAAVARRYDLNNRLHTFGLDQAWRRAAVREASLRPGDDALDAACGTGDLARTLARAGAETVTGVDFCEPMLEIARRKERRAAKRRRASAQYLQADVMDLPFADDSFDVVSIAFGVRNVVEPARALAEFHRVLRPGGRLVILEFDQPRNPAIAWMHDLYRARIMPWTATLLGGRGAIETGAYHYLPRSVDMFLGREQMAALMRSVGFHAITQRPLTMGVCVCHRGVAPV